MTQPSLYYRRLRRLSPIVITEFIFNRIKAYLRKLKVRLVSTTITDKVFARSLVTESIEELLQRITVREKPVFFVEPGQKQKVIATLETKFPSVRENTINAAEQICAHIFDLLGSGESSVNEANDEPENYRKIDWHRDFKSGERWNPQVFYTDTEIIKGNGSDIKVPWELSRFQHLPTLGKAYWLTSDEKYAREFVNEISDWIYSNPPQFGVNWNCTMEIAIRAVNWIWGYYFFKDSLQVSREFLLKFLKSLLVHGRHIRSNLERNWRGVNTNHYLSNLVGLVYLGVMFPEFKEAKK